MALQTQTYEGTSGSSYWRYTVEVTEDSTSTTNNTSSVTAKVYLGRSSSASYMIGCSISGSVTIGGTKKDYTYSKSGRVDVAVGQKSLLIATLTWTITHDSDGKKSVSITSSMTNNVNPVSGTLTSKTMTLTDIPRYATVSQSVNSKTETTVTMKWTSDSTIDYIWYSTNNGSTWTGYNTADGTSGTYTISGLSANTSYNIKTRVRRKDSQLNTDSSATSVTTYNWPNPTTCPSFTIGSSVTISLYNPLSRSCTVTMTVGGTTILAKSSITGTSVKGWDDSTSTTRLYASIPSAKSGTYTITVTYSGQSKTKTGTFSINESSCTPSIGAVTVTDENSTVTGITGSSSAIVQNKSSVRVKATSLSVKNSATISSVTFKYTGNTTARAMTVSGTTATANSTYTFANTSTTVTATITDSRGLTASKSLSVSVIPYSAPTANVSLKRENSYYTQTYLTVNAGASSVTVGGTAKNSVQSIVYATKRADSGTYSADASIANNTQVTFPTEFDNQYAWDFRIKVTDRFQTTTVTVQLSKGIPLVMFDRKRNSVGVNAIPTHNDALEVGGNLYLDEDEIFVPNNNTLGHDAIVTGRQLGNGVDLNNLIDTGIYYQPVNNYASGGSNYPTAYAGVLEVQRIERTGASPYMVFQRYTAYRSATFLTATVYARSFYTSWGNWVIVSSNYAETAPATNLSLLMGGNVRVLVFRDYKPTTTTFITLASGHRPSINVTASARWTNTSNVRFPALITVQSNGAVSASYYDSNTTTAVAISNGTLAGSITWTI